MSWLIHYPSTFIYLLVLVCSFTRSFICNFIALIMITGRLRFKWDHFIVSCTWYLSLVVPFYCTKMYPIVGILFTLSADPYNHEAAYPHVIELSGSPPVPNPILESQVLHSFSLLPSIPILALEWRSSETALKPSLLQWSCKEPFEPINAFHFSRPSDVLRYLSSAISEYRESACFLMTMNLSCWSIFIPRQILEKGVFQ